MKGAKKMLAAGKKELGQRAFGIGSVADAFEVSKDCVKRHVSSGAIKSIYFGGRVLIPATEVDRLEREGLPRRKNARKHDAEGR
jgi:hypothetical protein